MTDPPLIKVPLDEIKMIRKYEDYNVGTGSEIIKNNYLYSAGLFGNTYSGASELSISKYDLSTRMLVAVITFNLAQICPKLASVLFHTPGSIDVKWLAPVNDDELWLIAISTEVSSNILYATSIIKLRASDLSIIDISERQIDATPDRNNFVAMTFGKAKLKPESWFHSIQLEMKHMKFCPCYDRLRTIFNVRIPNGRRYVGGFDEGLDTPIWFAISCCKYYDTCLYASMENRNCYFGWGKKWSKDDTNIDRLYAVKFNENFSIVELKHVDIDGKIINAYPIYDANYSFSHNTLICVKMYLPRSGIVIMVFDDDGTFVYQIPMEFIIGTDYTGTFTCIFCDDPVNNFIYFTCYKESRSHAVLGYISFDHDSKTITVHVTNPINTGHNESDHLEWVDTYIHPEYLCLTGNLTYKSFDIMLFPVQWLYDNIVRSETFAAEKYGFDKKKTYEVQRTE